MKEKSKWLDTLDKDGVIGELCRDVAEEAKTNSSRSPSSMFAYAVWQACRELSSYYEDEQGIRTEFAEKLSQATKGPLYRLLEANGLKNESEAAHAALAELLKSLNAVRNHGR